MVDGDLFIGDCLLRHENGNVSVRLRQRIVDLVSEFQDIVLDFALGLEGRQEDLLDYCLEVSQPILRLSVRRVCLNHS